MMNDEVCDQKLMIFTNEKLTNLLEKIDEQLKYHLHTK